MFVAKLFAGLGAIALLTVVAFLVSEARPRIYRYIWPVLLSYGLWESIHTMRVRLNRIVFWIHGRTFREIPGKFLASLCLRGLRDNKPDNPDLIRIVELVSRYGTMPQKASFARAVIRDVVSYRPDEAAVQFLDLLERNDFKVGAKRRAMVVLQVAHATRIIHADQDETQRRYARALNQPRVRRALAHAQSAAPPRKGERTGDCTRTRKS